MALHYDPYQEYQPTVPLLDVLSICVREKNIRIGASSRYREDVLLPFFEEVRTMMPNDCEVWRNDEFPPIAVSCQNMETGKICYVTLEEMNRVIQSGFPFKDLKKLGKTHDPNGLLKELWGERKRAYFRLLTTEESKRELLSRPETTIYCLGLGLPATVYTLPSRKVVTRSKPLRGLSADVWFANESGTTWLIPHMIIFWQEDSRFNFGRSSPRSRGSPRSRREPSSRGSRGSRRRRSPA